jgi:tRNA modification GTPase
LKALAPGRAFRHQRGMQDAAPHRDTIFAPATADGRAGVAVIRVSGPAAGAALAALTGNDLPAPRMAIRARFRDPDTGMALDDGLALWFPGPASFTGEDVAELHIHGGRAGIAALLDALGRMDGLRLAEAGEFTRRALEAGKLDLTEIEGLADLIAAETEAQRRQALRQLDGELGRLYDGWREALVRVLAHMEAAIDFAEEDIPDHLESETKSHILGLLESIIQHLDDNRRGELVRDGVRIAILGAPNAGKSSLLNALARRDAAIVSDTAGTTRDVIELRLDLGGHAAIVADTAGLREAADEIEREGVRRAEARAADADIRVVLFDATQPPDDASLAMLDDGAIRVASKVDLAGAPPPAIGGGPAWPVSVKSGAGLAELMAALTDRVATLTAERSTPPLTRERHRAALEDCRDALARAAAGTDAELVAEDLRLAARALGRITGRVEVEDLLDVIFAEFCIGK